MKDKVISKTKVRLDLGSGPKNRWCSYDKEWAHLDCEDYEGVIKWCCPDKIPVDSKSIRQVHCSGLLIEIDSELQKELAREIDRVVREDGIVTLKCYGGDKDFNFDERFFSEMFRLGWEVKSEEIVWVDIVDKTTTVYFHRIELKRG